MEEDKEKTQEKETIVEKKDLIYAEEQKIEEKRISKRKKNRKKTIILITIIIFLAGFFSTIFAILNINNLKVINGTYIEGINFSNYTKDKLEEEINSRIEKITQIELFYGEYRTIVSLEDCGIEINSKNAIKNAVNIAKSGNIIIDNYSILKSYIFKNKLSIDININEEKLENMLNNIQIEIPNAMQEYSYEIEGSNLIILNGKAGNYIIRNKVKNIIIENIKQQFKDNYETIEISLKTEQPSKINIRKIYNEIYTQAQNAYIIEEPFQVFKEKHGIEFAITIEEAENIISEEEEKYIIPLKIIEPEIKIKDLGDKLFEQSLSKYTTIYDAGNRNRSTNIEIAASAVNGTILLPGETFSFNGVVGNRTPEKGYKSAGAYSGGMLVQSYGGGICQLTTTIYNAALYANLEIVERHNHGYSVSYVPAGRDATVSYGGKDFKFKNNRSYPIKIFSSAKNGVISVSVLGIKEEVEYEIELTSTVLTTKAYNTIYEQTNDLEEGKQKTIQTGHIGKTSVAYKIVKYNGNIISTTVLSKDTYLPMNKIVQVGTKKVEVSVPISTPVVQESINAIEKNEAVQNNTVQQENNTTQENKVVE